MSAPMTDSRNRDDTRDVPSTSRKMPSAASWTDGAARFSLSMNEVMNSGMLPILVALAFGVNSDHFAGFFVDVAGMDTVRAWCAAILLTGLGMVGVWELARLNGWKIGAWLMVIAFMVTSVAASAVKFEDGFLKVADDRAAKSESYRLASAAEGMAGQNLNAARDALTRATRAMAVFEESILNDNASDRGEQRRQRAPALQAEIAAARAAVSAATTDYRSSNTGAQDRLEGATAEGGNALAKIGAQVGLSPAASRWTVAVMLGALVSCGVLCVMYYATLIWQKEDDSVPPRPDPSDSVQPQQTGADGPDGAGRNNVKSIYPDRTGRVGTTAMTDAEIEEHALDMMNALLDPKATVIVDKRVRPVELVKGTVPINVIAAWCGIGKPNATKVQVAFERMIADQMHRDRASKGGVAA